ncbi:MAG: hypothetical protein QT11_C0001G1026 [archaeon GW2011_AR20]|nr:MAG: hypothetical protein QT11_C0001G1026 [archaeon GW2011_AR20]AQS33417.1 hypothetical protein [uncultured archaeon]AQS33520.1 hypothetical protein [uncultured archaeon]MBS3161004.1 M1 family metallopeptidase [Candidatus Woesearchaeota archaeon]
MNPYALSEDIKPLKYRINLTPNFKTLKFFGCELIEINISRKTRKITLNAQDLKVTKAEIKDNKLKNISYNKKYQTITFTFNDSLKDKTDLYLEFKGDIREDLRGWYKSIYHVKDKEKIMLTTQFEATDARKCFPCFDQPDLKAKFELTLNIPKNLDAVSNMPIKRQAVKNSLKTVIFQETPIMSTYLLAFVISELEFLEGKAKNNVKVRIYATPGKNSRAKLALEVTIKALEYYDNYFKIPYPLPKLDLIAIPDFESGAMENWGLITYRETQLLFDEKESSAGVKQNVAHTINHEIAHQWFGNLVTMKWWDDLWLNEGFASWIENKVTHELFPEFDIWMQYLTDIKIPALYLDSLNNTHPIEVDVVDPGEINEIFDAISYNKGSAVIRMLESYLGEEVFRNGLRYYLNKFKYNNATTDDLWMSLQKVSKKPVKKIMRLWTKQPGYPIINASLNNNKISLKQERFFYLPRKNNSSWHIPLAVIEDNSIKYYEMKNKNYRINKITLINPGQIGFYRVKYDKELFNRILNSRLNITDKIGLQNDFYAFARGCHIKLNDFLELIKTFKHETNHALWDDLSTSLGKTQLLFFEDYGDKFNDFINELYSEIYKKVGWDEKPSDTHTDILLRNNVLATLGLSNHEEILTEAKRRFNEHVRGNKINPDLRSLVYNLAAYSGDKKTFDLLKSMYLKERVQEEKIRLLASLCAFRQKDILKETLKFSLSKHVRSQDRYITLSMVGSNEYADDLAWQFLRNNWDKYYKIYGEGHTMSYIIKSCLLRFKSPDRINEIKKFFKENPVPSAKRAIEQCIESIRINYNFVNHNKDLRL